MAFDDFIDYLEDNEFLDNTGMDYLVGTAIFALSVFIFIIIKLSIKRQQKILLRTVEISRGEQILNLVNKSISWLLVSLTSIYFALTTFTIPADYEMNALLVIFAVISISALRFFFGLIDVGIDYQKSQDETSVHILNFFRLFLRTLILVIIFIWFLSNIGLNVNSLMAGFGILGLAVAFSLQNVFADIFASLTIFLDKPFELGDRIEIEGDSGTVESIGIRSTKIRTSQGELLIVSNKELTDTRIRNFKKMEQRRIAFKIGVGVNTPAAKLKAIPGMIEKIITGMEHIRFDRAFFVKIADFSFDYEIIYYVKIPDYLTYLNAHQSINLQILEAFEKEKITIPYPTQEVIVKK